jgi:hypothetical protein
MMSHITSAPIATNGQGLQTTELHCEILLYVYVSPLNQYAYV